MLLIIQSFNLYDNNILVNMSISSSLFLCVLIIACVANRSSDILYLTHFMEYLNGACMRLGIALFFNGLSWCWTVLFQIL